MPVKEWQTLAGNRPMPPLFSRLVRSKTQIPVTSDCRVKMWGRQDERCTLSSNRHTLLRYRSWENPTRQQSFVPGCFIDRISGIYSFIPNLAAVEFHRTVYRVLLDRGCVKLAETGGRLLPGSWFFRSHRGGTRVRKRCSEEPSYRLVRVSKKRIICARFQIRLILTQISAKGN